MASRFLANRIDLFEICDQVVDTLLILQPGIDHPGVGAGG